MIYSRLKISLLVFLLIFSGNILWSNKGGSIFGRTGAPGEKTCQNDSCHNSFALNSGDANTSITANFPPEGYIPGETYTISVGIGEEGRSRWGFQALAFSTGQEEGIGTKVLTDSTRTRFTGFHPTKQWITHTFDGIDDSDTTTWSFDWIAPEQGSGEVVFYASTISGNGNGNNKQDHVYTPSLTVQESTTSSIDAIRQLQNLKVFPSQVSDRVTISFEALETSVLRIQLLNLQGQLLKMEEIRTAQGNSQHEISIPDVDPGLYFLQIERAGRQQTFKLVKQ